MITASLAAVLLVLAALDGAFAGFRSSVGRDGLIDHRRADRRAAWRGLRRGALLLAPVVVAASLDVGLRPERLAIYQHAGSSLLLVYGPYAMAIVTALAVYLLLSWRWKYLASAVILGPGTLLRPVVAVTGGALAIVWSADPLVAVEVAWAVAAVLAVEPLGNRDFRRS